MKRSLALLAALLCATAAQAVATEAIRDATLVAIALRRTDSVETRQAALAETFEAAFHEHDSAELPVADAGSAPRKNWFLRIYDRRLAPAPDRVPRPEPAPSADSWLASAAGAAIAPWKALLEYAWGGAWAGTRILRAYQPPSLTHRPVSAQDQSAPRSSA